MTGLFIFDKMNFLNFLPFFLKEWHWNTKIKKMRVCISVIGIFSENVEYPKLKSPKETYAIPKIFKNTQTNFLAHRTLETANSKPEILDD